MAVIVLVVVVVVVVVLVGVVANVLRLPTMITIAEPA